MKTIDERREARATAYVMGEMSDDERAEFEREMAESAALAAEVADVRAVSAVLEKELSGGPDSLPAEMRNRVEAAAKQTGKEQGTKGQALSVAPPDGGAVDPEKGKKPFFRRASVWAAMATAALAIPAVLLVARSQSKPNDAAAVNQPSAPAATAYATAASPYPGKMDSKSKSESAAKPIAAADAPNEMPWKTGNRHDSFEENPFLHATTDPLSTFSIDVDTASYAMVRSYLSRGQLPTSGAVRIEEMVNYFTYDYPEPQGNVPFRVQLDLGVAPWAPDHQLVRVGLKGKTMTLSAADGVNLVFLVDTSGSMSEDNKLPLLKRSFTQLLNKLGPNDRIAIVAYAGSAGLVLPSTPASQKSDILSALDRLSAGGSTNGGAGIDLAYKVASEHFLKGGVNRVLLATDGDFNVGTTSQDSLVDLIQEKAKTGVFLSVLGFGMGNFNDSLLEKIADKGNGQYAYIDNDEEARRTLVDGLGGLMTIAKDVKIQIEWNPAEVAGYRLIGYENRVMANQDFNNDKKDAGELGSGHTVTALYEVIPKGGAVPAPSTDPLKYQVPSASATAVVTGAPGEMMTVKLRYKEPDGSESKLLSEVLRTRRVDQESMSADFKFAASVASFGMLLRGSKHAGNATYESVESLARDGIGGDAKRREFIDLVRKAASAPLSSAPSAVPGPPAQRTSVRPAPGDVGVLPDEHE